MGSGDTGLSGEVDEHVTGKGGKAILIFPGPIGLCRGVIDAARPGIGDCLAKVGLVFDGEIGKMVIDGGGELGGGETGSGEVVGGSDPDIGGGGMHEFESSADGIGHVKHRKPGVGLQEAGIPALGDCLMEDVDGIVGGAAAGLGLVADKTRIAEAADVDMIFFEIVLTEVLPRGLADAVHSSRSEPGVLRAFDPGCVGTKNSDGAWPEDTGEFFLAGELQDMEKALGVQLPGFCRMLLAGSGEHRREQIHLGDVVTIDDRGNGPDIEGVELFIGTFGLEFGGGGFEVGRDDVKVAVLATKGGDKLGSDLATGANNQDVVFFHGKRLEDEIGLIWLIFA